MPLNEQGEKLTKKRNKVVIDTNVLVSAFIFGGIPGKAVKKVFTEANIYVSPELLNEYRDVPLALESEGKINRIQLKALISGIAAFVAKAKIVQPEKKIFVCRDIEDNVLLECCIEANANILITGDKDLLSMKNLPYSFKILTPRKFIENSETKKDT